MNNKCEVDANFACCQHVIFHDDEEIVERDGEKRIIRHLYQTIPPGTHYLYGGQVVVPGPSEYLVP